MAENIFVRSFCEAQERLVCTTSAELNFDNYTDVGKYYIYEDTGNGKNKQYIVLVDYSKEGCKTQTKLCSGNIESRCHKDDAWTAWKSTTGGASADTSELEQEIAKIKTSIGDVNAIATPTKREVVSTLNFLYEHCEGNRIELIQMTGRLEMLIGNLDSLETIDKSNTVNAINELVGNIDSLGTQIGNIDTALDNIIAMQNSYIGGDSV